MSQENATAENSNYLRVKSISHDLHTEVSNGAVGDTVKEANHIDQCVNWFYITPEDHDICPGKKIWLGMIYNGKVEAVNYKADDLVQELEKKYQDSRK